MRVLPRALAARRIGCLGDLGWALRGYLVKDRVGMGHLRYDLSCADLVVLKHVIDNCELI